jgi:amino acid permease
MGRALVDLKGIICYNILFLYCTLYLIILKMKKNTESFVDGFFAALFLVFTISLLYEYSEQNRKKLKKLKKLAEEANDGLENDKKMLNNDWLNIQNDFNKNYQQLKSQYE